MCSTGNNNNNNGGEKETADCSSNYYCDCYYYVCENEYGYYLQLSNGNQEICLNSGETTEDCRNKFKQKYGSGCCESDDDDWYSDDDDWSSDNDDWYRFSIYIIECINMGHSEEDCETWYFE